MISSLIEKQTTPSDTRKRSVWGIKEGFTREIISELGQEERVGIYSGYGLGKGMFGASRAVIGWGGVLGEKVETKQLGPVGKPSLAAIFWSCFNI